ncbi:ribosomal protein S18 acetylase RimI-like enzyme [Lacibacter cauensis]|uniref:Ribosomal protein S18 acetylase RimI-like enzyme n=1 Tax=Lacibacter cauensis TaxID=510947 RepID=A0A562SGL8_9BACT|nr:GNAT family N-acetyltransferase [Lacibacter cauensis]TWI80439.1 ribosomal protein S18 acetylase RimI-like enzyme [Lacibacter cauensis]
MNGHEITVRKADASDAELIADLSRTSFYQTFAKDNTEADMELFMNEQFTKEKLMKEVEEGDGIFLLAYQGEEALGYARMRVDNKLKEEGAIEVARIYALDKAIGKGVGKALMQTCLQIAADMHMKAVWLGVWEMNHRAIAFYEKWGFVKFGEHKFLLGTDLQTDCLMKKLL